MEQEPEVHSNLGFEKMLRFTTSTVLILALNIGSQIVSAEPQTEPTISAENAESLKNLKDSKPQPNVPYSPEQKKFLDNLFENPGLASIRILVDQSSNIATIKIVHPDGKVENIKSNIVLPKPDKAKTLQNGYYLSVKPPSDYNPNISPSSNTTKINTVEPLDNVAILNPIVIQEVVVKNGQLVVLEKDPNPDGQRKLHSLLVPKNIGVLAAKKGSTFLNRSAAIDDRNGVFYNLPAGRQVILGDIGTLERFVQANQKGDLSWGCLRLPVRLSNKIMHDNTKFRSIREMQTEENGVNPNFMYQNDISKISPTEGEVTLMIKVVP